jgi:hypothetical protein
MQKTNIIPLNNIPQPWRDTIGRLQNKVVVLPSEPSEDEQMNLWRVGIMLDIALHWVVRNELNTKHKIPYSRKLAGCWIDARKPNIHPRPTSTPHLFFLPALHSARH